MANLSKQPGRVSYNGIVFNGTTRTTSVSIRPEETTDRRSVMLNRYNIALETVVSGATAAAADNAANRMRKALTKNGGALVLTGLGVGDIRVNVGRVRDVDNGPKVSELSFEPAGGDLTAKVRWQVSFAIPECDDAAYKFRAMDFAYTVQTTINLGYTTRTISGTLRVPQNRFANGVRLPQDSADSYLEQIVIPPPEGFKPVGGVSRTLSQDRSTLTFNYAHAEMGRNVMPVGVTEASASHTMTSSTPFLMGWQVTINGSYEVPKGGQARDAVLAFQRLVAERQATAQNQIALNDDALKVIGQAQNIKNGQKVFWLPIAANVSEPEIYGPRKLNLSMTFQSIGDLYAHLNGGIFTRLKSQNRDSWRLWWASVNDNAFHPRGTAKLVYDIGDDRITDLCDAGPRVQLNGGNKVAPQRDQELRGGLLADLFKKPTPLDSWLMYLPVITVEADSGNSLVRTMPDKSPTPADDPDQGFDFLNPFDAELIGGRFGRGVFGAGGVGDNRGPFVGGRKGVLDNNMVQPGGSRAVRGRKGQYVVTVSGTAMRAFYPVPRPTIHSYAGLPVVPLDRLDAGEGFGQTQTAVLGQPLYVAKWRLKYGIEGDLGKTPMEVPPNVIWPA